MSRKQQQVSPWAKRYADRVIDRAIEDYPFLEFFPFHVADVIISACQQRLEDTGERSLDSDFMVFLATTPAIIRIAGSVYSELTDQEAYGCDEGGR